MRIRLAKGSMWGLPSWGRRRLLTSSEPECDVDADLLSEEEARMFRADLASGVIADAEAMPDPVEDLLSLPLPEFRRHVLGMVDAGALRSLQERASALGMVQHGKMLLGALRALGTRQDPFLPRIEIDGSVAEMEDVSWEEPATETVADLISGFESWARLNGKGTDQEAFQQFLMSRPDKDVRHGHDHDEGLGCA